MLKHGSSLSVPHKEGIFFHCTALIPCSEGLVRNGTCPNPCFFSPPSVPSSHPLCVIQDDAGQLLGAKGPEDLSERGRSLLSGLGCV